MAAEGLRPTQARGAPPGFNTLLAACWALDPAARPSAAAVAVELSRLLREQGEGGGLGLGDHAAGAAPGAAGAAVTTGGSGTCAGLGLDSTAARQDAAAAADGHANANGACSPGSDSARADGAASGHGGLAQAGAAGGTAHESAAGPAEGLPGPDPAAQAAGSAWPALQWSDMPARPYRPEVRLSSAPAVVLLKHWRRCIFSSTHPLPQTDGMSLGAKTFEPHFSSWLDIGVCWLAVQVQHCALHPESG